MNWRVVNSGIADAATNMAVDEAILHAHRDGLVPPTLRFYGWQPAAVSLGYFQRANAEIDLAVCREQGIDVVRRLTGGRAVLHDAELTYSIIVREGHPILPKTITASYRFISEGLLAGLKRLGIEAQMTVPQAAYGQSQKRHTSAACFDAPSHYEITVERRKLVGSAQVRKDGILLQHGSILLKFSAVKVVSLLRLPSQELRDMMIEMLNNRAVSLSDILGREVSGQELCGVMTEAFGPALGVTLAAGELTAEEQAMSRHLAETKYRQDSWNLMR
jgi:lipoyl(octanoyl) transferase